jgi:hypothetical protein
MKLYSEYQLNDIDRRRGGGAAGLQSPTNKAPPTLKPPKLKFKDTDFVVRMI